MKNLEKEKPKQLTPLSYFGQREWIVDDLFALLGNRQYQCWYDLFAGSGSVSFAGMERELAKNFFMNDSFFILTSLWELIKTRPQELIAPYSSYIEAYIAKSTAERNDYYSKMLLSFNECCQFGFYAKAAILFAFLINYSEKGVPVFNKDLTLITRPRMFLNIEDERTNSNEFENRTLYLSELLNKFGTAFSSGDFFPCLEMANKGDFVFLDPPYPSQLDEIYYKISPENRIKEFLGKSLQNLTEKKVDFLLLYGARVVSLENQFDEDKFHIDHLIRLSTHPVFGHFLDHIYVSKTLALHSNQLPLGMGFYCDFFSKDKEMDQEEYDQAMIYLQSQKYNIDSNGK